MIADTSFLIDIMMKDRLRPANPGRISVAPVLTMGQITDRLL